MKSDVELLRDYAENGTEAAFTDLVARHIPLVYSTALRLVNGDTHLAQDVTQRVFSDLARKAKAVAKRISERQEILPGWLFTSSRFAATTAVRANRRRNKYEQEAISMLDQVSSLSGDPEKDWAGLRPLLDEAMSRLPVKDRDAVVLRFFQGKELSIVGATLGLTEDAARMRVSRALAQLRRFLTERGVNLSDSVLTALIASHSINALPPGLAAAVAATATSVTAATGVGFLKMMVMAKFKSAALAATIAGLAAPWFFQHRGAARLRRENQTLINQIGSFQALQRSSAELAQQLEKTKLQNQEQLYELMRLRAEAAVSQHITSEDTSKASTIPNEPPAQAGLISEKAKLADLTDVGHAMLKFVEAFPTEELADKSGKISSNLRQFAPAASWEQIQISFSSSALMKKSIETFPDTPIAYWKQAELTTDGKWKRWYVYADREARASFNDREDMINVPMVMKDWLDPTEVRRIDAERGAFAQTVEERLAEAPAKRVGEASSRRN